MTTTRRVRAVAPPLEVLAVIVANLLPLVGVVALEWSVAALVTLYWFELGVLCFWAVVRAIFAGRPSEFDDDPLIVGALADRPVAIPIPRTGLGIQVSTLPVLVVVCPILALVWFVVGAVTVGVIGDEALDADTLSTVTVAVLGILVSEGARTALEYFYGGEYREHSAQTAIQGVFLRGGVLFLVGLFTTAFVAAADGATAGDDPITAVGPTTVGIPLLIGVVLVKFGFDLAGLYHDRLVEFDESLGVQLGWAYEPPTNDRVDASLSDAERRVCPPLRGRLFSGLAYSWRYPGAWFVGAFPFAFALLFAVSGAWKIGVALATGSVLLPLLLVQVDYWLRYAGVEYRVDGDAIVAYDRLFQTPLWRVEPWDESGIRVERDRIDEWLETSTIVIELPDREVRLPRLPNVEPVLEVFDRLATRPDSE